MAYCFIIDWAYLSCFDLGKLCIDRVDMEFEAPTKFEFVYLLIRLALGFGQASSLDVRFCFKYDSDRVS